MLKLLVLITLLGVSAESRHCRCQPHEPCWPSDREWQGLNTTIGGNLAAVKPVASVCHDPTFNDAACKAVASNYSKSQWRASQPGTVQWANWEAWPQQNQACYLQSSRQTPCGQGRISIYSAAVKTAAHIQATVRFAKRNNIRLVIKNSGHDFLGRSAAANSLQIHTHWMNSITFSDNFVPEARKSGKGEGLAVTIGAGVILKNLYNATKAMGVTVVGGTAHTVGTFLIAKYLRPFWLRPNRCEAHSVVVGPVYYKLISKLGF